ncbi:hypothetical protein ABH930_001022 [Kitasatospora sp. GAS204A]|uniref:OmpL47-type beta-barrel domain-containing protein n=1 Tax=unclassified Kitasatospora TaxID=2633591 RepID=UPI002473D018|nr:hypothetical protein [Kitasatospora sp. GAS204B]MDH6116623.1 hypothetical protein [Kitasatospora sp. GAS204B]
MALAMLTFAAVISPAAAARREGGSVTVNFTNSSDRALTLASFTTTRGCLIGSQPSAIAAGASASWSSGPCLGSDGSAGNASFRVAGEETGTVQVSWNSPTTGPNTYTQTAPGGYVIGRTGGEGSNPTVQFTFDCNSTTCDGIPDDWKRNGVTIDPGDGSGPQFIDLPAMGATVNKPDIFVQLDWMADATHNHALDPQAIRQVVEAFKNSPYSKHSPTTGINLHIDAGSDSILNFDTNATWGTLSKARQLPEQANLGTLDDNGDYQWDAFNTLKTEKGGFVSAGRAPIFHYAISADHLWPDSTTLGIAALPGSDFILSLGALSADIPLIPAQAVDFMHELGHNLSLRHGGDADLPNNKPQYFSVMNYSYSIRGLTAGTTTGIADYSREARGLNEVFLNEGTYPFSSKNYDVVHYCQNDPKGPFITTPRSKGWVDWNCNGTQQQGFVTADVNGDGQKTRLTGHDDWAALLLRAGTIGRVGAPNLPDAPTPNDEPTMEQEEGVLPLDTTPPVTTAATDPAGRKDHVFTTDVTVTLTATDDISGVDRTEYNLDGAGWTAYTGPITLTTDGRHELLYRSIDFAQNQEADNSLTLRIDCDHGHDDGHGHGHGHGHPSGQTS